MELLYSLGDVLFTNVDETNFYSYGAHIHHNRALYGSAVLLNGRALKLEAAKHLVRYGIQVIILASASEGDDYNSLESIKQDNDEFESALAYIPAGQISFLRISRNMRECDADWVNLLALADCEIVARRRVFNLRSGYADADSFYDDMEAVRNYKQAAKDGQFGEEATAYCENILHVESFATFAAPNNFRAIDYKLFMELLIPQLVIKKDQTIDLKEFIE